MMNMKLPEVITPPSIYHTWNTTSYGGNTKTHHNSASQTCTTSEGDQKRDSHYEPRARKKATTPDITPRHPRWHIGNITNNAPIQ